MEKTEPNRFAKSKRTMGEEWNKLVAIATKPDQAETANTEK
jgi:hypothetical protein